MPSAMEIHQDDATGVTSITIEIPLAADAAFVWDVIRDVNAADTRLIPGFATALEPGPDSRTVTFATGLTVTERIVEIDEEARRLVYQAIDLPGADYHQGTQVVRDDDARACLVWTTAFAPPALLKAATANVQLAAELMRTKIDSAFAGERRP
jgi:hypothetical protein